MNLYPKDFEKLSRKQFNNLIEKSNNSLIDAYSRMDMTNQPWTKHTSKEIDFLEQYIPSKEAVIVDVGCGIARHIAELYKRGYHNVYGYDFSTNLIEKAKQLNPELQNHLFVADCRNLVLNEKADVILCLYDVIGSFADQRQNLLLINSLKRNCKKSGCVITSVMNFELTKKIAKHTFNVYKDYNKLFRMDASSTMQKSGNVFNPDFYVINKNTHVVYRKEMFTGDGLQSSEYIVRDRRFSMKEITSIFKKRGFSVIDSRYVQAGRWDTPLENTDSKAKEILLVLKRK